MPEQLSLHPQAIEQVDAPKAAEPEPQPVSKVTNTSDVARFAKCTLKDPEEEAWIGGTINFSQMPGEGVRYTGTIEGITPGPHGFHVHTSGDLRGGCSSTAGHYVGNKVHVMGTPMLGDLNPAVADENGVARINEYKEDLNLSGAESIIGRSLVIHAGPDGSDRKARIACCTIGHAASPRGRW